MLMIGEKNGLKSNKVDKKISACTDNKKLKKKINISRILLF